jgi:ribosome biogenesis GTPase / thiamine phosphate phosphatase
VSYRARVIAAFGRHLIVRDTAGVEHRARPFGRRLSVVCGDEVLCELDARHEEAHVTEISPRTSCLYRSNLRGDPEPVAANLSLLLVTLAPLPEPDLFIVDRYLCAAACAGLRATVVLNKADLGGVPGAELACYARIGYACVVVSARSGEGLAELKASCRDERAALVGQSGVGKSSLVGALVPDVQVRTGALLREEEGRHTTTVARLYELAGGGALIDSPGVRDFAPAPDQLEPTSLGFVEIAALAPGCRFDDCRHLREPGCAVRAAVEAGTVSARRYESYRRLRRLREQLQEAAGRGRKPR